ncbi:MAG TPA: Rieske 2Fe-2S domain-containing protein [Kofleriaceae bacterium]|nr:Rieske 2Fe-2S domain-containing protein [Kofleriaceae bacterium]
MPVLTLQLEHTNFLAAGDASFALVAVDGELLFIDARCPHRGGPLHLGAVCRDARGRTGVKCPWHGTFVPAAQLRRRALPMVWRADTGDAVVVVPAGAEVTAMLRHPHATHPPGADSAVRAAPCLGVTPDLAPAAFPGDLPP